MKYPKFNRPNEDIHVISYTIPANTTTIAVPFENLPYSKTQSLVTEIIRISIFNNTSDVANVNLTCSRGQTAALNNADPAILTQFTISTGIYEVNFSDAAGNGLLVPEQHLFLKAGTQSAQLGFTFRIYYKLRIVDNEELFVYYYNYNKA